MEERNGEGEGAADRDRSFPPFPWPEAARAAKKDLVLVAVAVKFSSPENYGTLPQHTGSLRVALQMGLQLHEDARRKVLVMEWTVFVFRFREQCKKCPLGK